MFKTKKQVYQKKKKNQPVYLDNSLKSSTPLKASVLMSGILYIHITNCRTVAILRLNISTNIDLDMLK